MTYAKFLTPLPWLIFFLPGDKQNLVILFITIYYFIRLIRLILLPFLILFNYIIYDMNFSIKCQEV